MGIIKHRPTIRLRLPAVIHPGSTFDAEVQVSAKEPIEVASIDAWLTGTEKCTVGSGKQQKTYRRALLRVGSRLADGRTLPAGRSSYSCRVALPPEVPPSYSGRCASTRYTMTIRIDIPWWPDRKSEFTVPVGLAPVSAPPTEPRIYSTNPSGPQAGEPHFECSLDAETIPAGSSLSGSVALFNVEFNRYRKLQLALSAREARRDTRHRPRGSTLEVHRFQYELPIGELTEGEAIPFNLRIPDSIQPSYESHLWSLSWRVEIEASVGWAKDATMRLPIQVIPRGSRSAAAPRRYAAASVGSERVRKIWQNVADTLGVDFDGGTLQTRRGDVKVIVRRDHRGRDGIFLLAELRYPHLQLHLDGGLASSFQRLVGAGVALGDADWDKRHYLAGREAAQIAAFGRALLPALTGQTVADVDDEHLLLERRDAGQTPLPLHQLTQAALDAAAALPLARAAIPPPALMKDAVKAWQRLAKHLRGRLETARMAARGQFEGTKVEVWTEWSAEAQPERTALILRPGFPIEAKHQLTWSEQQFEAGDPKDLPARARAFLPLVQKRALALVIGRERIELSLKAPLKRTGTIIDRLGQLHQLAGLLRSKAGPYR